MKKQATGEYAEVSEKLDAITIRLDVIVNLLLDILPEESFSQPRKLTHKVARLDSTGIDLRPTDMGRILGRPSKDISSRRREYKATVGKRQKKSRAASKEQVKPSEMSES